MYIIYILYTVSTQFSKFVSKCLQQSPMYAKAQTFNKKRGVGGGGGGGGGKLLPMEQMPRKSLSMSR